MVGRYAERRAIPQLRTYLVASWAHAFPRDAAVLDNPIVPDGCLDIVAKDGELLVAGPDTGPAQARRRPGSVVTGVRFRPGMAPAVLGLPARELRDMRLPLADLWGEPARRVEQEVFRSKHVEQRLAALERAVLRRLAHAPAPDAAISFVAALLARRPSTPLAVLERELELSQRQLRRRFEAAVGYGPKTFARVVRFQRMLRLLRGTPHQGLAVVAASAGYSDQAHMTREAVRLAGATPAALRS